MDIHEMADRIEDEKKKRAKPGSTEDNRMIAQNALNAMNKMGGMSEGTSFATKFIMPSEIEPEGRRQGGPFQKSVTAVMEKHGLSREDAEALVQQHLTIAQDIFSGAAQDYRKADPLLYEEVPRVRRFQPTPKPRTKDK